jgi:hypothetical protein
MEMKISINKKKNKSQHIGHILRMQQEKIYAPGIFGLQVNPQSARHLTAKCCKDSGGLKIRSCMSLTQTKAEK